LPFLFPGGPYGQAHTWVSPNGRNTWRLVFFLSLPYTPMFMVFKSFLWVELFLPSCFVCRHTSHSWSYVVFFSTLPDQKKHPKKNQPPKQKTPPPGLLKVCCPFTFPFLLGSLAHISSHLVKPPSVPPKFLPNSDFCNPPFRKRCSPPIGI